MHSLFRPLAFVTLLALGGCADYDRRLTSSSAGYLGTDGSILSPSTKEGKIAESKSYWDGNGVSGAPSIVVSIPRQTASFYKGDKLVGVSAISSGKDGHATPAGNYKIIEKKVHHASNLYGNYVDAAGTPVMKGVAVKTDPMPPGTRFEGAPMPYWMRLTTSGVGLHQGFLPGVPDSRGCIRLPETMAKIYFESVALGTRVTVVH
ncbi:MAG: L,D-transpeptidase family protein [Terrimicrobiaceae bacterium]